MSSIPLISHHLFVAAAKTKGRAGRRGSRVQPRQGQDVPDAIEISLDLLSSSQTGAVAVAWPMELPSRNRPAC
jgi:hypothetical protein